MLCLALCAGAAQQSSETATPHSRSIGIKQKAPGVPNFGEVTPNLYRGGEPSYDGLATLKSLGVDVVVDLRGSANQSEKAEAQEMGMQYISIPSHCPFPGDEPWAKFLRVVRDNPDKKLFVHCRLGDDRTGMAVAAYRMAEQGWSADEAMNEMQTFGFTTLHRAICLGMASYEAGFPEKLKTSSAFKDLQPPHDAVPTPK